MSKVKSRRIAGLQDISKDYACVLCDVWGVLHNGEAVFQAAADALAAFREQGGIVVMLTNSPRPHQGVIAQLRELGVAEDVYDDVVTSGDATRTLIQKVNGTIFHLGPDRDKPLFENLDVNFASLETCDAVVCSGLFHDEREGPEDYRERLTALATRNIPFICANPDVIVERGSRMIYCAGSLANLYAELGGETLVAGKPHAPIYQLALDKMNEHSKQLLTKSQIIAVGDGMPTDVLGAQQNGFDLLYISAGIHHADYGPVDDPDEAKLEAFLQSHNATPTVWMPRLVWSA